MATEKLNYTVECRQRNFFERIAAFNCEDPALGYAAQCSTAHPNFTYRVVYGPRKEVRKVFDWHGAEENDNGLPDHARAQCRMQ
jgi:hypothetical protein